jgi:hypothetical protein
VNRLETVALFTALDELQKAQMHDSVSKVIQAVLTEAKREQATSAEEKQG